MSRWWINALFIVWLALIAVADALLGLRLGSYTGYSCHFRLVGHVPRGGKLVWASEPEDRLLGSLYSPTQAETAVLS